MSLAEYDIQHPHERDRGLPPILDEEGRCLRCGCEWRDEQITALLLDLDARDARVLALLDMIEEARDFAGAFITRARRGASGQGDLKALEEVARAWLDRVGEL